ncbi:MAG: PEP-CTERM sorting domain-containing protein [Chthoniobacter sp.]|nr:PEP-CTERM sorting domain-containing protein [Chthoniobacter sp.]
MKNRIPHALTLAVSLVLAHAASAQITGPSSSASPYALPSGPNAALWQTTSILSVTDGVAYGGSNPAANPYGVGNPYRMVGIPDGLGAFDNGDGTITVLMNHEIGNTVGITREHGALGSFVSSYVIDKNTLAVTSGQDLMKQVYGWNSSLQQSNTTTSALAFTRFCSADLPAVSAFYNAGTGLGTTERIFMHGEESGATGWQQGTVATGADAGKSYVLGKFNLTTNGSGLTGVGGWENALANPFAQDKTIVIGNNDGGTGIMNNALAVYVGTKTNTGSAVDKAGLTNGTLKFVSIAGNAAEIVNGTTRATNITNGTSFTLSSTASTVFSRPEDGAWNPLNANQYYFVTTDRIDQVSDGLGAQIGQTRLWRLNFTDITNPDGGGTIDLLLDGATVSGQKTNMFDNMTVSSDGTIYLQEDVGGSAHNGKIWQFDPGTSTLTQVAKHDVARFGDVGIGVTAPFSNDEEASGVIDITSLMAGSVLNTGLAGEKWLLSTDQAHYSGGIPAYAVEGGQLLALHLVPEPSAALSLMSGAAMLLGLRRRRA